MILVYGIPNCDSVKKARVWLTAQGLDYQFHDFKKLGIPAEQLARWCEVLGWKRVLNKKGTTWRQLDAAAQAAVQDSASAQALLLQNASAIKRPIVDWGDGALSVGFDAALWAERLPPA